VTDRACSAFRNICRLGLAALTLCFVTAVVAGADAPPTVKDFGAKGDGVADDTGAFEKAVSAGEGAVRLPRGRYRLTRTVVIDLDRTGPVSLIGDGTATVLMEGAGPAFRFVGTHGGTASPATVKPNVWLRQRTPLIDGFEILGANPKAVGVELRGTMQAIITRLGVRRALHGIVLTGRNRNVIIGECQIYHNRGAGILMERLNLHQVNISNSHISYNGGGGIVARESEIRHLQIGTCDIEDNMDPDGPPVANILLDVRKGSVREGAIIGCTLQHGHNKPDSANIRFLGRPEKPRDVGYFSIANNAMSDVRVNVHLKCVRGVTLTGNSFWRGYDRSLLVEGSSNIVLGPNLFDENPDYRVPDARNGILFVDSSDCTLSGVHINASTAKDAALLLRRCRRIHVTGATILGYRGAGVWLDDSRDCRLANLLLGAPGPDSERIRITGGGNNIVPGDGE